MSTRALKERIALLEDAGFELLYCEKTKGSHTKLHMRYHGEDFFVLTSHSPPSDRRALANFKGMIRHIKKAVDDNDPVLRAQYLPQH